MLKAMLRQAKTPLAKSLDIVRHEDKFTAGVPDMSYAGGWIEAKYVDQFSKGTDNLAHFRRFTPSQRRFLIRRGERGQAAWLMLGVGVTQEVYLIPFWYLREYKGQPATFDMKVPLNTIVRGGWQGFFKALAAGYD